MFITYAALLCLGAVLLMVDLLVGLVLVAHSVIALGLAAHGVETVGRVTEVGERRPGRKARVQVTYQAPGGEFRTRATSDRPQLGAPVPVRYHPARPARATTSTRPWRTVLLGVPTVLVLAAASAGMLVSAIWYFGGIESSRQLPLAGASAFGALTLACAYGVAGRCAVLLRWRRMVPVDGKVRRYSDKSPAGPGILVSFDSADGPGEFWARAGTVVAGIGDVVTVYYDPARPSTSATVQTARDVRGVAVAGIVFTLTFGALAIFALTTL